MSPSCSPRQPTTNSRSVDLRHHAPENVVLSVLPNPQIQSTPKLPHLFDRTELLVSECSMGKSPASCDLCPDSPHHADQRLTDEVTFYKQNGWVKLDKFISAELAAELLARAKHRMGGEGDAHELRSGLDIDREWWHDYHYIAAEDEVYGALAFGKDIGRNAQRLMDRDIPVRVAGDVLAVKLPGAKKTKSRGTGKTDWHQDYPNLPFDRVGILTFWIALDEVTPDMGAMRFFTGSHRLGSLGVVWPEGKELPDVYPNLKDECPLSPELHYRPGDATAHAGLVVHGAPQNTTDRPRWAYVVTYFPADTIYTGASSRQTDRPEFEVGKPFDHPTRFRIVYP